MTYVCTNVKYYNSITIYLFQSQKPMHEMNSASKKNAHKYSEESKKIGIKPAMHDERLHFCLLCQQCLTNESMKPGRLVLHLKAKHSAYVYLDLNYFKSLKEELAKRSAIKFLFTTRTVGVCRTLEASYEMSLLIAKCGKSHTIVEDLIKPSITAFLKTVLEKDDNAFKAMRLSNNTVSKGIDEMSEDIETQLVEKLKSIYLSLQMDKSTLRGSEVVLLAYTRYIDKVNLLKKWYSENHWKQQISC